MSHNSAILIDDLFEINQRLSLNLWYVCDANNKPAGLSPRLIFPKYRDGKVRISEQESKIVCCDLLSRLSYYYSVETPTKEKYKQSGETGQSAQTDLTLYSFDGRSFNQVINIEFKAHNCDKRQIAKDLEKLVREGIQGNWFHTLKNTDSGTIRKLFKKFTSSFLNYSKKFYDIEISIVFCFCVLEKAEAYIRHFSYNPSKHQYEEYVTNFFDPSKLEKNWRLFSKKVTGGRLTTSQNEATRTGEITQVPITPGEHAILQWERASDLEICFDLQVTNPEAVKVDYLQSLLEAVEKSESNLGKNFNKVASTSFRKWLDSPAKPLNAKAYALLSNWFLGKGPYKTSPRAVAARNLWHALFCVTPERRLTNWRKGGDKILPEEFNLWWPRQLECQGRQ